MTAPLIFTPEYYARMRALEGLSWWNAAMRDVAGRLLDRAVLPARGVLLDIGCGSGQTMAWFEARYPGWRTLGIDVSREAIAAAQQARPGQIAGASALALPFADASVDAIVTLDVVQHLPLAGGDDQALAEMRRVLKAGGVLMLRTNAQMFPHTADDATHAYHRYEPGELRAKLTRTGFIVHRLGRLNAVLGLAEIPRELRARSSEASTYHGLMSTPRREPRWLYAAKRTWLSWEGWLLACGLGLPFGRAILALCEVPRGTAQR